MKNKGLHKLAVQSLLLLVIVVVLCVLDYGKSSKSKSVADDNDITEVDSDSSGDVTEIKQAVYLDKEHISQIGGTYIKIPKSAVGSGTAVYLGDDYMNSSIGLTFEGTDKSGLSADDIVRVRRHRIIKGHINSDNSKDFLSGVSISTEKSHTREYTIDITLQTKHIYDSSLYETDDSYYISIIAPRKKYDKIVVIDAGHGGRDEGAASRDGKYLEKDLNLAIVDQLKTFFKKSDIKVYYTRQNDKYVTKKARTHLANELQADLLVSVHCNASDKGDTSAYGVEALYSTRDYAGTNITGRQLAHVLSSKVSDSTSNKNRGVIRREGLYLMHHSKVPVSIIEVGYMSNNNDMNYIRKKQSQKRIAKGVYESIISILGE